MIGWNNGNISNRIKKEEKRVEGKRDRSVSFIFADLYLYVEDQENKLRCMSLTHYCYYYYYYYFLEILVLTNSRKGEDWKMTNSYKKREFVIYG